MQRVLVFSAVAGRSNNFALNQTGPVAILREAKLHSGFDPIAFSLRKTPVLLPINAVPVSDEVAKSVWLLVSLLQLVLE